MNHTQRREIKSQSDLLGVTGEYWLEEECCHFLQTTVGWLKGKAVTRVTCGGMFWWRPGQSNT